MLIQAGLPRPYKEPRPQRDYRHLDEAWIAAEERDRRKQQRWRDKQKRIQAHWAEQLRLSGLCEYCCSSDGEIYRRLARGRTGITAWPISTTRHYKWGNPSLGGSGSTWSTTMALIYGTVAIPCPHCRQVEWREWRATQVGTLSYERKQRERQRRAERKERRDPRPDPRAPWRTYLFARGLKMARLWSPIIPIEWGTVVLHAHVGACHKVEVVGGQRVPVAPEAAE